MQQVINQRYSKYQGDKKFYYKASGTVPLTYKTPSFLAFPDMTKPSFYFYNPLITERYCALETLYLKSQWNTYEKLSKIINHCLLRINISQYH